MIKNITGTWFEFEHHNQYEGVYWNPACKEFTEAQWRTKVDEIKSLDMKYIVLLASSFNFESYFKSKVYPLAKLACENPIEALLDEADKCDIKVFISVGFYGEWTDTFGNMTKTEVRDRAFTAMGELYEQFGHHKSFYGWYLPDETCIDKYFHEAFIKYVNEYSAYARTLSKGKKILIAPYGTNILIPDDKYVAQLESLDCDIIAYQDEIGVRKSTYLQTPAYYEGLRKAHDKAGRGALWADMEIFEFEGNVYRSALLPSNVERITKQLEAISPYVDEVLCYQYLGMMNKPGTTAFCGHEGSTKFYADYFELLKKIKG